MVGLVLASAHASVILPNDRVGQLVVFDWEEAQVHVDGRRRILTATTANG